MIFHQLWYAEKYSEFCALRFFHNRLGHSVQGCFKVVNTFDEYLRKNNSLFVVKIDKTLYSLLIYTAKHLTRYYNNLISFLYGPTFCFKQPNHGLLPTRPTDNPPIPPLNYGETPYFEDPTYHRGGQHNFRGRFPRGPGNGSPVGFRGRGRGRSGPPRGGRGRGGVFRPRGNFRERMFNQGGF